MLRFLLAIVVALGATSCSKKEAKKSADPELGSQKPDQLKTAAGEASVVVTVTVDWEGAFLSESGLEAMQGFREDWPKVPLTHFVCPAYFTQEQTDAAVASKKLRAHIAEGDEVALHLHAWFSLARKAGVTPRAVPNFYADSTPLITFDNGDQGYEVSIDAYEPEELDKIVKSSLELFQEHELGTPTAFRAGGYAATPKVLTAVRKAGLTVDASATWSVWYGPDAEQEEEAPAQEHPGFQSQIKRTWPNIEELTQPFGIDTSAGAIIEVPNTGSFAEYASADEMLGHLQRALLRSQEAGKSIYVDFGFHQETADEFIASISDALYNFNMENPGVLEFSTVTKVARGSFKD